MGSKLKTLAVIELVLGLIGSLFMGLLLGEEWRFDGFGTFILIAVFAISVIVTGMFIYAFGEMVEDIHAMRMKYVGTGSVVTEKPVRSETPQKNWWEELDANKEVTKEPITDKPEVFTDLPEI